MKMLRSSTHALAFLMTGACLFGAASCDVETTRENDAGDLAKGDSCITVFYGYMMRGLFDSIPNMLASNMAKDDFMAYMELARSRMGGVNSTEPIETYSKVIVRNGVIVSIDIRRKSKVVHEQGEMLDDIYITGSDFSHWKVSGYTMNLPAH